MLAVMFEWPLAVEHLADDCDIFAGTHERFAERHAMPALDDLRPGGTDAAQKPVARQRLQGHRRHRGAGRRAGRHLHDAGARLDASRARQHPGDWTDRVCAVSLAGPYRVETEPFGFEHQIHIDPDMRGEEFDCGRELHDSRPSPARAARSTVASQSAISRSNGSMSTCSTPAS